MSESIYIQHGYENRNDYLMSLSEEYCIPYSVVSEIAELYGESEDFDGLVMACVDASDRF